MSPGALTSWQFWALASAAFAALTAIFAKIGVENVGSDFATFIRTIVIFGVTALLLLLTGQWQPLGSVAQTEPKQPNRLLSRTELSPSGQNGPPSKPNRACKPPSRAQAEGLLGLLGLITGLIRACDFDLIL